VAFYKFILSSIVVCTLSLTVTAQNEDVILNFDATEFNGKVLLTWEIEQGYTCNGVQILRSIDSVNFTQIGSIEGICGSTLASIKYNFTDLFPEKNEVNYYRLSLGGIGFSWIISAEVIDVGANNYVIRPNPIVSNAELLYNNDSGKLYKLTVYNNYGEEVYIDYTNSESFIISKQNFSSSGKLFFVISSDESENTVKGNFLVQ
jgi:hypothetical protein